MFQNENFETLVPGTDVSFLATLLSVTSRTIPGFFWFTPLAHLVYANARSRIPEALNKLKSNKKM